MRQVYSIFFSILLATSVLAGENWPQFRGPSGDGQADADQLPLTWSETKNVNWKTEIHGKGWSSPVVWGDQVWVTTATVDGKQMFAVCVDRNTGEVVHDLRVFENAKPDYCHPTNSYASPTPVIEQGRLYVHFGKYGTACVDTKMGRKLWERRDFPCNHWRGPGSSPIIHKDLLIVAFDGYDDQYLVALNKTNGETVWKKDRNIGYGTDNGDRMKAYGTCTVFEYDGRTQLISPSATASIAYDPATGKELWRVQHGGMNAAARPLFGHGLVYISAGAGPLSLIAVRPDGTGDVTQTNIAWNFGKSTPKRPSQLLVGDRLFMIDDKGVASCLNAKTASVIWQQRIGGNFRASPIHANGRIYLFSLDGVITVIEAGPSLKRLAKNRLDNGFQASPAVVENKLILRTTKHLYCIKE